MIGKPIAHYRVTAALGAKRPAVLCRNSQRFRGAQELRDARRDGRRFLSIKSSGAKVETRPMNVVLHWTEGLRGGGVDVRK